MIAACALSPGARHRHRATTRAEVAVPDETLADEPPVESRIAVLSAARTLGGHELPCQHEAVVARGTPGNAPIGLLPARAGLHREVAVARRGARGDRARRYVAIARAGKCREPFAIVAPGIRRPRRG